MYGLDGYINMLLEHCMRLLWGWQLLLKKVNLESVHGPLSGRGENHPHLTFDGRIPKCWAYCRNAGSN